MTKPEDDVLYSKESHFATNHPAVLTFGEPLVVLVPDAPGTLSSLHQFRPYPAGAELNTAVGLARLGVSASCACCVGDDPLGDLIRHAVQAEGVDARHIEQAESAATGLFFKQWTGLQNKTSVYYYRSSSPMAKGLWNPAAVRDELSRGTWSWVHATGITWMIGAQNRAVSTELFQICQQQRIPISFDINVRLKLGSVDDWRALVNHLASYLTWFILGDEEAEMLFGTDAAAVVEHKVRNAGFTGKGVILKRGAQGASASVDGDVTDVPAWSVARVVDTVGAGDGYNAGFIAGMLRGWSLVESMRLGSVVGAFAVTSVGDFQGYPTWKEAVQEMSGEGSVER